MIAYGRLPATGPIQLIQQRRQSQNLRAVSDVRIADPVTEVNYRHCPLGPLRHEPIASPLPDSLILFMSERDTQSSRFEVQHHLGQATGSDDLGHLNSGGRQLVRRRRVTQRR